MTKDGKRVFLMVLDSVGAGALPDAAKWGDEGCCTLRSIHNTGSLNIPTMQRLGIGNIEGLSFLGECGQPSAAVGRLAERSQGKDTTIGHWEISGIISERPLPTYPNGFPQELLERICEYSGRGWLCNMPYSGTEVIKQYGIEHIKTGKLIIYTSADSVMQIAAHTDVVPLEQLYDYCRYARSILTGEHGVGRVIARPFTGEYPNYTRTAERKDFSIEPPEQTFLDCISAQGLDCISIGKIKDIFCSRGLTECIPAHSNDESMAACDETIEKDFSGLCFINLVDFDMQYGHRQDAEGYAQALNRFDRWLDGFIGKLRHDDLLLITADHGCDPADQSTDHTREYVPLLAVGENVQPINLGTRGSFADIAATVCEYLGVENNLPGDSFLVDIIKESSGIATDIKAQRALLDRAWSARKQAYVPYSGFAVGAALLTAEGKVYTGCNIENAAYPVTCCAERTALFKAVSEGERSFSAIAVVGGRQDDHFDGDAGSFSDACPPCGMCRQALSEFCGSKPLYVIMQDGEDVVSCELNRLLPYGFNKNNL